MSQGNSAPPQKVEEMFDRISRVYDGMNLAISGFQEPRWRKRIVAASGIGPGDRALDVACGTGKVTTDLYRAAQPGGAALGAQEPRRPPGGLAAAGALELDQQIATNWSAAAFIDSGNAYDSLDEFDPATSVGAGIRWFSPLGPIRFDVAAPLDKDAPDNYRVHITLGPDL